MKLYLLGAALLCFFLACHANPIIVTAETSEQSLKDNKETKEEANKSLLLKIDDTVKSADAKENDAVETVAKEKEEEEVAGATEVEAAESTTVAAKKASEGRAHHGKHHHHKGKATGRQSSDDDDDDDDDDDILGDDDDDDDDDVADDDDDDDDDEGGDYFGFFDDILGGDDDDDDDDDDEEDEPVSSAVVTNAAQAAQAVQAAQVAQAASEAASQEQVDEQLNVVEDSDAESETGGLKNTPKMPQMYVEKYNSFVDVVLNRINRALGKEYDPVRVKLLSQAQRNNVKEKFGKNIQSQSHKMGELELNRYRYNAHSRENRDNAEFVLISKAGGSSDPKEVRATPTRKATKKPSVSTNNKKTGNKKPAASATKQTASKNKPKAKATLFGLSTLKRDGDVMINMSPDYTTVKTNFMLGPLTLRVERQVSKSGKRELRSATATTEEMFGRLVLKLAHGGTATLHSIKVLQPKQVRIDSSDNNDKTTEFMWKRSPQIATVVSQTLSSAARALFKPPPQPRP